MFNYPNIDPVAVSLGPLNIHWYAISYLLGFLLCWRILLSMSPMQRQPFVWRLRCDFGWPNGLRLILWL